MKQILLALGILFVVLFIGKGFIIDKMKENTDYYEYYDDKRSAKFVKDCQALGIDRVLCQTYSQFRAFDEGMDELKSSKLNDYEKDAVKGAVNSLFSVISMNLLQLSDRISRQQLLKEIHKDRYLCEVVQKFYSISSKPLFSQNEFSCSESKDSLGGYRDGLVNDMILVLSYFFDMVVMGGK